MLKEMKVLRLFILVFVLTMLLTVGSAISAKAQSPISDAFASCTQKGSKGGVGSGNGSSSDLFKIDVITGTYPSAVCNDGTPAIFYIRRASAGHETEWHIHLQGGGSCSNGTSCARRWCSDDTNFGADKMSTAWGPGPNDRRPDNMNGQGILSHRLDNNFRDMNHVFVNYCSSDGWSGRRGDVDLETLWYKNLPAPPPGPTEYRIHFRGADIIDAVISMLETGISYTDTNTNAIQMPSLITATHVLFTGSSGGGDGVISNADRLGARLAANNVGCASGSLPGDPTCPLYYRAVPEAAYQRNLETRSYENTLMCQMNAICSYEAKMRHKWFNVNVALQDDPLTPEVGVEDDCETNEPGTEWKCADTGYILENHLSTPVFVRNDLQDNLQVNGYIDANFGSAADFGQIKEFEMRRFKAEDPARGVFGPQCQHHTALTSNEAFNQVKLDVNGTLYSFRDLLWNWWTSTTPDTAIATFRGPGTAPDCP